MRLLNVNTLEFAEFRDEPPPKYAIASHRWIKGCEVTLQEFRSRQSTDKSGYRKIVDFANYVKEHVPTVKWLWVDTCCINKDSAAELSEAINLMFKWYRNAEVCIAYLADVDNVEGQHSSLERSFQKSEWFERGWTLQELLAPRFVVFVTNTWELIGTKGIPSNKYHRTPARPGLEREIAARTGIPEHILHNYDTSQGLSVKVKLEWMAGRKTTRPEDMSYALYGIFGVTPGVNYGEEHKGAQKRLLGAIQHDELLAGQQAEQYRKIATWLSPSDPWTNHKSARQRHEPRTGAWLLGHNKYRDWKAASLRHLWLYGKVGCGKTVLFSTAIEDIRTHCESTTNAAYAVFYLSFSDTRKQRYEDILLSWITQLGWREPALSMLQQVYEKPNQDKPRQNELEDILLACASTYDEVLLLIDALDECPEDDDIRHYAMESLARLSSAAQQVRFLVTSRELPDIRDSMVELEAESISIETRSVDLDIRRYMSSQLSRDHRLSRLDSTIKVLIEDTISQKADGMFRWAFCQMQVLKKLKSTRPRFVKEALYSLPQTLDETYERILTGIDGSLQPDACKLLRWIAYAKFPPTLGELVEVAIIDLTTGGSVEVDDRPGLDDTLEILSGLISIVNDMKDEDALDDSKDASRSELEPGDEETELRLTSRQQQVSKHTRVRLAHFSVKEYLESERIRGGSAKDFFFESSREHSILCQSCITYITYYSRSAEKLSTKQDRETFPLIKYAARSWFDHSALQKTTTSAHELGLLRDKEILRDWLDVYRPYRFPAYVFSPDDWKEAIGGPHDVWPSLYYASELGLQKVVRVLLATGADVNAQGGHFGNALQPASHGGHEKVVQMLIDAGAEVDAQGGPYGNALQAAASSYQDSKEIVQMLIDAGANVNAQGGYRGNTLQTASENGHERVVQVLIAAGASLQPQGGWLYHDALQAASHRGHWKIVQTLIAAGIDVNAQGGRYGNALQAASYEGHEKIVQTLIAARIDVNAQGGKYGNALQAAAAAAAWHRNEELVRMLIQVGSQANAQGGYFGNALQAASYAGRGAIAQMLIEAGANVNERGGRYGSALQAAYLNGDTSVIALLTASGAVLDTSDYDHLGRSLLHIAACEDTCKGVELFPWQDFDVNMPDHHGWTPLHWAAYFGNAEFFEVLQQHGADHSLYDWQGWTPRQIATFAGQDEKLRNIPAPAECHEPAITGQWLTGICDSCGHVGFTRFRLNHLETDKSELGSS